MFKSKGGLVVLLWIFSGSSVFQCLYTTRLSQSNIEEKVSGVTITRPDLVVSCFFLYPLIGWIADVKFGRYTVIKWSFILLLVFSGIFCIISIFQTSTSSIIAKTLLLVWHVPMSIVTGGIIANVLQFGTDQLYDSSSSDVASFLRWTSWVWILSGIAGALSRSCFCKYPALADLFLPAVTSLAVCSDFMFNSWLVKESPSNSSPFNNIYKIIVYAIKHKYPMKRAPNDWDESSTRLDVGKTKYGGPFSSEEVEDVKTFFRMIAVLFVCGAFVGLFLPEARLYYTLTDELASGTYDPSACDQSLNCFQRVAAVFSGDIAIVLIFPLLEIVFFPLCQYNFSISILKRVFFAMFLAYLSVISTTLIVFTAQQNTHNNSNGTSCFQIQPSISYLWMAIPYSLQSVVQPIFLVSCAEFIIAQTPYSLKGFIVGITYGLIGFFSVIGLGISFGFKTIADKLQFHRYGCTFWYYVLILIMFLVLIILSGISFKFYKRRQREDKQEKLLGINYYS